LDDSIPDTNYDDLNAELSTASGALAGFMQNYSGYINYDSLSASNPRNTYFLRSEYADTMDLEITKTFVDTTPEFLQTDDIVNVELTFKNTGTKTLNNIAYVDNIPRNFTLPERKFEVVGDDTRDIPMKPGLGLYDFLIDGFFLAPGEEVTVRYALKTLPLKYGYMQV